MYRLFTQTIISPRQRSANGLIIAMSRTGAPGLGVRGLAYRAGGPKKKHVPNKNRGNGGMHGSGGANHSIRDITVNDIHRELYLAAKCKLIEADGCVGDSGYLKEMCHPDKIIEDIVSSIRSVKPLEKDISRDAVQDDNDHYEYEDIGDESKYLLIDYIRNFSPLPEPVDSNVDDVIYEIILANGVDHSKVSVEMLVTEGLKDEKIMKCVSDLHDRYCSFEMGDQRQGKDDKMERLQDQHQLQDRDDEAEYENFTEDDVQGDAHDDKEIVYEIMMESCGFNGALDVDISDAVRQVAAEFALDDLNYDNDQFKSAIDSLRNRFKSRPGVQSDSELRRQKASHDLYERLVTSSDLIGYEDFDRLDDVVNPLVTGLLKQYDYDLNKISAHDITDAVSRIKSQVS